MATVSVSFAGTLINPVNFFAFGIYDASNGSLLETVAPTKGGGYTNPLQVTFLNSYTVGKVYRVIVWENTTAVVGGTSRVSGSLTPSVNSTSFQADKFYTYGTSLEMTDSVTIVDPSLIGWGISFEQFGSGTLKPGTDYTYDPATGTIILINGTTYQTGQEMIVHSQPKVAAVVPPPSAGVVVGRVIAVNTSLSNADANSAIALQGSGGSFIVTLPALSTMSDFQPIEFYSAGGNHIYATLAASGSDKIQWNALRTKLFMRQATNLVLFKMNGVWNVKGDTMAMCSIGEIVYRYGKDSAVVDFPYLIANGSLINRATYAGLFDYFSNLPGAALTAEATWGNPTTIDGGTYYFNKGRWTTGDASTTIRVPLLFNQFIRGADGSTRQPGSFQPDAMQLHTHDVVMAGTGGSYPNGRTPGNETVGGDTGGFTRRGKLSSPPYDSPGAGANGTLLTKVSTETRPENVSLYALIRL